jgi:hypothetical protein
LYQTSTPYGYFALALTPVQPVTVRLGYDIVDNQGNNFVVAYAWRLGHQMFESYASVLHVHR